MSRFGTNLCLLQYGHGRQYRQSFLFLNSVTLDHISVLEDLVINFHIYCHPTSLK